MEQASVSSRYAWGVVTLLTLAYILSFIDRQVLGLLITPIKSSLHLSDTEIGLLMGPAFAIFYVTLGWPVGWLADRANRRNIIVVGVALWSAMTAACGLSRTFVQLFLARIGVGVGEAALTPSALSMIADYFPKATRPRAISFYTSGIYLGSGLAYLVGGAVLGRVRDLGAVSVPLFGAVEGWQVAFLVVALPGLIVALAVRGVREPARAPLDRVAVQSRHDETSTRYLLTHWRAYGPPCFGMCAATMITYLGGWYPPLFERVWHWPITEVGFWLGFNYIVFGPLGTNVGGALAAWLARRGVPDASYRLCLAGNIVMGFGATALPLMPLPQLAIAAHALFIFCSALASAMGSTAVVTLAPERLRAQATAIYFLIINLIGLSVGPTLVGVLTDRVFTDPTGIAQSIAVVSIGATIPAVAILWLGRKPYRSELDRTATMFSKARA